jgi:hypothetical protein
MALLGRTTWATTSDKEFSAGKKGQLTKVNRFVNIQCVRVSARLDEQNGWLQGDSAIRSMIQMMRMLVPKQARVANQPNEYLTRSI